MTEMQIAGSGTAYRPAWATARASIWWPGATGWAGLGVLLQVCAQFCAQEEGPPVMVCVNPAQ